MRWQRAKLAAWKGEESPARSANSTRRKRTDAAGSLEWENMNRTNWDAAEAGRRGPVWRLKRAAEKPRGSAGTRQPGGTREPHRVVGGGDEGKNLKRTENSRSNTLTRASGKAGGGGQPQTPAPPAVSTYRRAKPERQQPEDQKGGAAKGLCRGRGQLRERTTGSTPTAGKDGSAEGPR